MKRLVYMVFVLLLLSCNAFAQQPEYPDSGFTNKAEAKNLIMNGKKEGKWCEYSNGGLDITSDTNAVYYILTIYKAGVPTGIVRKYYGHHGVLCSESPYKNGKLNGVQKIYRSYKGSLMVTLIEEKPYVDGEVNGIVKEYNINGGLKSELSYINGKAQGMKKQYFSDGHVSIETPYVDDLKNGLQKMYNSDGTIMSETTFADNVENGISKTFYNNGIVKDEKTYDKGKITGVEKFYYRNGKIETEIEWVHGVLTGAKKKYSEHGKLLSETKQRKDSELFTILYYEDGDKFESRDKKDSTVYVPADFYNSKDTLVLADEHVYLLQLQCLSTNHLMPKDWYADNNSHIFNSQEEANKYYKCTIDSIDFSRRTLLHYPLICTNAQYRLVRTIKYCNNSIICEIHLVKPKLKEHEELTMVAANYTNEIIIPKISKDCKVSFRYYETEEDDFWNKYYNDNR